MAPLNKPLQVFHPPIGGLKDLQGFLLFLERSICQKNEWLCLPTGGIPRRFLCTGKPRGIFGDVAYIQLRGEPYQKQIEKDGVKITIDSNKSLNVLAQRTNYINDIAAKVSGVESHLSDLFEKGGYYTIQQKIEQGKNLTFDEAFGLGVFVCAALNRPLHNAIQAKLKNIMPEDTHVLQATTLLSAMSTKEAYVGLSADEIAGMVAATIHLDTVVRTKHDDPLVAFGGMGGDKGYPLNSHTTKLFSLSTLAAVALSLDGAVHKHHSYPNTSKVAGQSAIEAFGARSDFHTPEAFEQVLRQSNLLMTSCHNTRTLHSLSHKLKGETVNHVIGPLAFTLSAETPVYAMIGVNEKVHPSVVVDALSILSEKGFQRYENSAVYCGTLVSNDDEKILDPVLMKHVVVLDEVAPPPYKTIVAFLVNGENAGTYVLSPEDFYDPRDLVNFSPDSLAIPNTYESIMEANISAIEGSDITRATYLAMTVGLGLFVRHYLADPSALDKKKMRVNREMLRKCTKYGLDLLLSGKGKEQLDTYVAITNKFAGEGGVS